MKRFDHNTTGTTRHAPQRIKPGIKFNSVKITYATNLNVLNIFKVRNFYTRLKINIVRNCLEYKAQVYLITIEL